MITIRPAATTDAGAIAEVRAQRWRGAYQELLAAPILSDATGPASIRQYTGFLTARSCRGMLVAEPEKPGAGAGPVIGFASFGPERDASGQPGPAPQDTASGTAAGEPYAIYVAPAYWSGQAGWRLLTEVVSRATAQRYTSLSLWVLAGNTRARRFYERGGFAVTGESQTLDDLGGVTEIRYWRPLTG